VGDLEEQNKLVIKILRGIVTGIGFEIVFWGLVVAAGLLMSFWF
jgi:hypothetical protein